MEEGVVNAGVVEVDDDVGGVNTDVELEVEGGGRELEEVDGVGSSEVEELDGAELADPVESPALKTTILAVMPFGTVATQKSAPPAPAAASELVTSFIPLTEGSIEQGRPLQPSPSHSIFSPQPTTS